VGFTRLFLGHFGSAAPCNRKRGHKLLNGLKKNLSQLSEI